MLRRNLSDDTRASLNSAMIWSLAAILFIVAAVPGTLYATEQIQDLSEDASYFSPHTFEDLKLVRLLRGDSAGDRSSPSVEADASVSYAYYNQTGATQYHALEPYTKNFTGQDYHELIVQVDCEFDEFRGMTLGVNYTLGDMIANDVHTIEFTARFPRNTSLNFEISAIGQELGEAVRRINENEVIELNVTTDMDTYTFSIPFSKLLQAHSELGDDARLVIRMSSADDSVEEIQPADILRYDIDLIHSTSKMNSFLTVNVVSGILGTFLMIAAVFSTPWVDLKDLTGRF